jgi:hypothetical protein
MIIGCTHSIANKKNNHHCFQQDKLQASNTILSLEHQPTSTKGNSRSSKLSLANITNDDSGTTFTQQYKKYKKKNYMKNRTTTKRAPTSECLCPLKVHLFCYSKDRNWYVSFQKHTISTADVPTFIHRNHLPVDPCHLITRQNLIDNTNVKTKISEYIDQGLSDNDICKIIKNDWNINLTASQIHNNRKKLIDDLLQDHLSKEQDYVNMSSVDNLLLLFQQIKNASYIYVQHSIDSGFVTYNMSHKEKCDMDLTLQNEILTWRQKLKIQDSENILVSFAWCHDDEKRKFLMFPEYLAIDMTFGLNKERRNLVTFAGVDGHNKAFTALRCWMPSKKYVAYHWAVREAFPTLMGMKVCSWNTADRCLRRTYT